MSHLVFDLTIGIQSDVLEANPELNHILNTLGAEINELVKSKFPTFVEPVGVYMVVLMSESEITAATAQITAETEIHNPSPVPGTLH